MEQNAILNFQIDNLKNTEHEPNRLHPTEEQMSRLFQSPTDSPIKSREYHDDSYHLDFPSNEGALMTIGFLTFAVFLIKLVLVMESCIQMHRHIVFNLQKLISALKNKNNGNGTMTTTVMPTALGRGRRDVVEEEAARILRSIEEYDSR